MLKHKSIPQIGLGSALEVVVNKANALDLTHIEKITFEDTLKYIEIPDFLKRMRTRVPKKVSEAVEGAEKIEEEPVTQPIFEEKESLDSLVARLAARARSGEPVDRVLKLYKAEEYLSELDLKEDPNCEYYKVDFIFKEVSYVVLLKVDLKLACRYLPLM